MNEHPEPENEPRPTLLEKLTLAGRLLLIITVLLFCAGFYFSFFFFAENFPPGHYPLVFVLMPVFLGCFFFFLFVAWILERCGIKIYAGKSPNDRDA